MNFFVLLSNNIFYLFSFIYKGYKQLHLIITCVYTVFILFFVAFLLIILMDIYLENLLIHIFLIMKLHILYFLCFFCFQLLNLVVHYLRLLAKEIRHHLVTYILFLNFLFLLCFQNFFL